MIDFPDSPTEGQIFVNGDDAYIYEDGIWQKSQSGYKLSIGQFTDVTNNNPQQYQGLRYNGTKFVNTTLPDPNLPNYPSNRYIFHVKNGKKWRGSDPPRKSYYGYTSLTEGSSVVFDPENMVDTLNRNVDIPVTGYWRINLRTVMGAHETNISGHLYVNNVERCCLWSHYPDYGDRTYGDRLYIGGSSYVLLLNAGDVIDVRTYYKYQYGQNADSGYVLEDDSNEFSGFLLREL